MTGPLRLFPFGLVGGDGRRLRLGSHVARLAQPDRHGEVTGWAGPRLGAEVFFHDTDTVETIQPAELLRIDLEQAEPVTVGWVSVDDDTRPTLLVVPVGTRDLVTSETDPGPFPSIDNRDVRASVAAVNAVMADHPPDARPALAARHFDAPMLRRVLDEATLPATVHRLVFVATDQVQPQRGDTVGLAAMLALWLEGRRHFDPNGQYRPVSNLAEPGVIRRLPHILDAVVHQVTPAIVEAAFDCERVVVAFAGGTPAMMFGCSIAASRRFGGTNTRIVQIPQAYEVDGDRIEQPLIEMDLADTALHDTGN